MGSQQSQPSPQSATSSTPATSRKESSYDLATRKCATARRHYDACYTAALSSKEENCGELFDVYKSCFLKWMSVDMKRRGVQVSEGSMVGEFLEEEEDDER